jgi:hypothetical protein
VTVEPDTSHVRLAGGAGGALHGCALATVTTTGFDGELLPAALNAATLTKYTPGGTSAAV